MKNPGRLFLGPALALVLAFQVAGAVDVAGIIETGGDGAAIDSVEWTILSHPAPLKESTPGWGGEPNDVDTIQLQPLPEWPAAVVVFYRYQSGREGQTMVNSVQPNIWYEVEPGGTGNARFMLRDTVLVGISAGQAQVVLSGLAAFPNPFTGTSGLRIASRAGPTEVRIADAAGRTVWAGTVDQTRSLDTRRFAPGVYLVQAGVWRSLLVRTP
ncbi:T9SS type A sorting domain-containing protein [candidate division WOR-3 bacterium]|nr:T9SS type A sorting domain-containing protein [candidate division WOR-3 bacterium]